ncbi:hypothetical protein TrVE_jg5231 [Triparma verrucosa]|uniref:Kinetochore protein Spc24 n=1 Tax=Triparma verrucosa TaxID=1606542 RepID=A0A9W7EKB0_9STRA|nr:hypothetical protein TrVE_jg5231 [Triparma verrucosa]
MVAGNSTISWEATLDIMRELTDLYKGNETDDVADAGMISTMVNDVRKASEEMRSSLASQVDVLAAQVAEAEARCERENNDEFSKKMEELSKREESLNEEVKIIGETTEEIQKRINMYKEEAKAETAAMEECESTKMEEIPRIKHAISLYANITGIKFDYSKEGKLAGHIAIPQSEEVHSFNIDAAKCSGFEIANQLWGMMEPPACE